MKPSSEISWIRPHRIRVRGTRGAALLIVLAFMVLLAGLVLVFLKRTSSERIVSDSNSNQTQVNLLLRGAVARLIEDMRGEIMDSSASTHVQNGGKDFYVPIGPANMVMARTD